MARGRRKKLAAIEVLDGKPGKRPVFESGIDAFGEAFIPEHLVDDARGCIEVIKQSMPPRVYSALDSFLLSAFGMAWALHKQAAHRIGAPDFEHLVLAPSGAMMVNPWIAMLNKQAVLMASLGDRLGLDPKSRAALKLPDHKVRSKFDGLIGQQRSSISLNA